MDAVRPQVIPATRVRATPHLLPTMANLIFEEGDSHLLKTSPLDYQQFDFPRDAHPPRKIKDGHRTAAPVTLPHFFITSLQILVQTALSLASVLFPQFTDRKFLPKVGKVSSFAYFCLG